MDKDNPGPSPLSLAGSEEKSMDDVLQELGFAQTTREQFRGEKLQDADLDTCIGDFPLMNELLEMMEQCGCDLPIKNKCKPQIIQSIMLYDALLKRKLFLDAFGEGLEVFGVWSTIVSFPELMKPVFVPGDSVTPSDVLSILRPELNMGADQERVWGFLTSFIRHSSENVLLDFVQFITGCSVITGNSIKVTFSADPDAVVSHTCSKELQLSTAIKDKDLFFTAMRSVIKDKKFTIA